MNKKKGSNTGKIIFFTFLFLLCLVLILWVFLNITNFLDFGISSSIASNAEKNESFYKEKSDSAEHFREDNDEEKSEEVKTEELQELQDTPKSEVSEDVENVVESKDAFENIGVFIYFSDENGEYLVGELRYLSSDSYLSQSILELLKGPTAENLVPLIPSSTKLIDVYLENNIAKINFSKGFIEDKLMGELVDRLVIYSIVNTVTEFEGINAVEFYVEKEKLNVYGQLDISEPINRNPLIIKHHD